MSKFKVGDKVKVIDDSGGAPLTKGEEYVISGVYLQRGSVPGHRYELVGKGSWQFFEHRFALVPKDPLDIIDSLDLAASG